MSTEKRDQVLDAATNQFIRYGFRRTTMGDIAEAAEMSRPAVYLVFQNKEEIFRGVIERRIEQAYAAGRESIAACQTLAERINAVFQSWVVDSYQIISQSPEAQELYETSYSFAADLIQHGMQRYESLVMEAILSSSEVDEDALARLGLDTAAVAHLLARSTWKLDRSAGGLDDLQELLSTTVRIYVTVLTGGARD